MPGDRAAQYAMPSLAETASVGRGPLTAPASSDYEIRDRSDTKTPVDGIVPRCRDVESYLAAGTQGCTVRRHQNNGRSASDESPVPEMLAAFGSGTLGGVAAKF